MKIRKPPASAVWSFISTLASRAPLPARLRRAGRGEFGVRLKLTTKLLKQGVSSAHVGLMLTTTDLQQVMSKDILISQDGNDGARIIEHKLRLASRGVVHLDRRNDMVPGLRRENAND